MVGEPLSLGTNLRRGHYQDCITTEVDYFDGIKDILDAALKELNDKIYAILEENEDVATKLDKEVTDLQTSDGTKNFATYISVAERIQDILRETEIPDAIKTDVWKIVSDCYLEVTALLKERIKPLKERTLLQKGADFDMPVDFEVTTPAGIASEKVTIHLKPPRFTYAYPTGEGFGYGLAPADDDNIVFDRGMYDRSYVFDMHQLPTSVQGKLRNAENGECVLSFRVAEEYYGRRGVTVVPVGIVG